MKKTAKSQQTHGNPYEAAIFYTSVIERVVLRSLLDGEEAHLQIDRSIRGTQG